MDGDDSDEGDEETLARQQAAYELQQEYDYDFVPAFYDAGAMSFEGHPCDLDVDCAYDPYPPEPILAPRA
eukprot:10025324-Heterocapsa_arctica.AAC.1